VSTFIAVWVFVGVTHATWAITLNRAWGDVASAAGTILGAAIAIVAWPGALALSMRYANEKRRRARRAEAARRYREGLPR
jgi:hypothetical protein